MAKKATQDLTGKVNWLLKNARAQGVARRVTGREVTSYPTLGEACDVAPSNFKPDARVLTDRIASKLRWTYAIDIATEDGKDCWDEFEVGSLEDFCVAFATLHPELRYVAVPIEARIGSIDEPEQRVYVRVELRSQDADPTNPTFDAELVCQVFTRVGVRLAVRRGALRVECRKDLVPLMSARLGGKDGGVIKIARETANLTIRPGGREHMHWEIETTEPPIGVLNMDLEGLFKLTNIKEGDEFDVTFLVEDYDLEAHVGANKGGAVEILEIETAEPAIVRPTGEPLGIAKRQLMAHIAKHSMELFGPQRSRTAVLCRYAFRIAIDHSMRTA